MTTRCAALWLLLTGCDRPATDPQPAPVEQPPPWQPPDAPGGWPVGARTETLDDPRTGPLTLEIWYPSDPGDADIAPYPDLPLLPLPGVFRDVPPAGRDHPVVLFSHGYGGTRHQSVFLTEHLASHGFVVVGVDHRHNTALDLDADLTAVVALRRPLDLQAAADHVLHELAGGWLDGRVRTDQLGVLGHSFGAFTALVSGGGRLDIDAGLATCATEDLAGCAFVDGLNFDGAVVPEPDPRIAAVIALAPGGWYAFGADGLGDLPPTLILGGRLDGDLPYDEEIRPTWERIEPPATLVTLERAGHWGFTDLCGYVPVVDCAGEDKGFQDPLLVQQITRTRVAAFAGWHLAGDDRYLPWLDDASDDPDVTVEGP